MDLFDFPVASGRTDTSSDAAETMSIGVKNLRRLVYQAIHSAGHLGLTTREIASVLGRKYSGVQPRTSELRDRNHILDSGQRRKQPGARCKEIVWIANEASPKT